MNYDKNFTFDVHTEKPAHCDKLNCLFSKLRKENETSSDEFGQHGYIHTFYYCSHPRGNDVDVPQETDCPIIKDMLITEGFLEKCKECGELEMDFYEDKIDAWCNEDRLLECILEKNK